MVNLKTYRLLVLIACFVVISTGVNAQCYFHRLYDNNNKYDAGRSVIQTYDDGYIACGITGIPGAGMMIVKTNACGDTLWTKNYDFTIPSGGFNGNSILQLQDSTYVICGSYYDTVEGSATTLLLKLATNGDTLWFKPVQGDSTTGAGCTNKPLIAVLSLEDIET